MKYLSILLFLPLFVYAQVREKLIATPDAAAMVNYQYINVNTKGQYCIDTKIDGQCYFYTDSKTLGPFKSASAIYGNDGHFMHTDYATPWYYKNAHGCDVYGPVDGKLGNYLSDDYGHIGITISRNDSIFYYVNGRLVNSYAATAKQIKSLEYSGQDWCTFSPNGNYLYTITSKDTNYLYKNGKLINSSKDDYKGLHINNNGTFTYATGHKPEQQTGKYDYMYTIHSDKATLSPVRTVWENTLRPNGGYYYTGDDNGTDYIAINNKLFKSIESIHSINLPDKKHFAFAFSQNGKPCINADSKITEADGKDVAWLNMDKKGNYAFAVLKDYYYYKYINGKKQNAPLTRFGVRPQVLYISPKGEAMLYFKTQDSVYVYRDDKQLISSDKSKMSITNFDDFFNYATNQTSRGYTVPFYYINQGNKQYILYKEIIWETAVNLYDEGNVVASLITDDGFFIIYKLGENRYGINVNNSSFAEFTGPEKIITESSILEDKKLVFFGIKNNSIYQYTLKL